MSDARILACRLVTRPPGVTVGVVMRFDPFHRTTDDEVNVLPLTVRVKPDSPAVLLLGLREVMTGNGAFTLKLYWLEEAPLGLMTCALQVEGSVPSVTLMDTWVELVKLVEMFEYVPLKLTPRKVTVQPDTNPLPVMVSVWPELEPVAGLGLTLLTVRL